ncbi:MAG: hypothetical protein J6Q30_07735, partial [Oscillospiraceae bacterium]|nr:hypothetical protein [Oscillospiraceae bacterium]
HSNIGYTCHSDSSLYVVIPVYFLCGNLSMTGKSAFYKSGVTSYCLKIILYKMRFPNDHRYNNDIIDYLNDREDISHDDMVFILEELGFVVFEDGRIKW